MNHLFTIGPSGPVAPWRPFKWNIILPYKKLITFYLTYPGEFVLGVNL